MSKLVDRAKMFTSTVGAGTLVLTDVVAGHQSFEAAGVTTGDSVSYALEEGVAWELGTGTYNATGNTLTRVVSASSNAGNQIVLAGNAVVYVTIFADQLVTADRFATVATTGAYADLSGLPTLGTAAETDATAYATAAQGTLATTALQPSDLVASVRTLWVDPAGNDSADGDLPTSPLATVGAAVSKAAPGDIIRVRSGTYTETCPMILPRDVSVFGDGLRNVEIRPTEATENNNMWLVDSGAYLWGMTFARHQVGSFAVAFNAAADNTAIGASGLGAFIRKSPYVQNCSSYTAAQDAGTAGSTSVGATGGGMEVDGAKCAPNSPIRSMVVDSYTQVNLNGLGCVVKNDAYAQLVSFFGTFCSEHVVAESGGQVNLSNSTTNFGTFGLVANGRSTTPIFSGTAAAAADAVTTLTVDSMTTSRIGPSSRPAAGMVFEVAGTTYTVTGALPNGTGFDVNFYPTLDGALTGGETVDFFQRSQISTGGHVMEFVGSGTNYNALPWFGGVPIPANEIVENSGGRVFFSSTDQLGNFRVGPQFDVNGTTGSVTINTDQFNLSGLNAIGPFSRDGFTAVGVQLREVSNNTSLLSSTGAADGNTAPTQFAVKTYLDTNYTLTSALATVATSGAYSDLSGLPTLAAVATTGAYADLSGLPTLGTAAALDVGVSANQVVQLDGSARLPALDASQLTNIGAATGVGDVVGPASAVDGHVALFDGTSGKLIKSSGAALATVATTGAYGDLSGTPTLVTALDGLSDVALTSVGTQDRLRHDGTQFVNAPPILRSAVGNATGATTINLNDGEFFTATATGAVTWTFSTPRGDAAGFILRLTNGGAFAQTWPASVDWPGGEAPTLIEAGVDVLVFVTDDGGTKWRGALSMGDSK